MKSFILLLAFFCLSCYSKPVTKQRIFDVHIHGTAEIQAQLKTLAQAGVYKAAISTSWDLQQHYQGESKPDLLFGLMFPCPNGKVPYSLQPCYEDGKDWPSLEWVEQQLKDGKIDFMGEILSQYYGISSSDSLLFPYYALAEKYNIPVGIHTGGAGPGHGSPNFKMDLGNPLLMEKMLAQFPKLRVWIMHGGDQFYQETVILMQKHKQVYTDISVISNPDIMPPAQFTKIMKAFMDAGLEDRLMFGTDNGNVEKVVAAIHVLDFLSKEQKDKIFYRNAERFFEKNVAGK